MQALGTNDAQTAIGIAQHKHGIGLCLHHQLVAFRNDVAHCLAEIGSHGFPIHIGCGQLKVLEEHTIEVVVVVLPCMRQQAVEIPPALINHSRQADNFGASPHNNEKS